MATGTQLVHLLTMPQMHIMNDSSQEKKYSDPQFLHGFNMLLPGLFVCQETGVNSNCVPPSLVSHSYFKSQSPKGTSENLQF